MKKITIRSQQMDLSKQFTRVPISVQRGGNQILYIFYRKWERQGFNYVEKCAPPCKQEEGQIAFVICFMRECQFLLSLPMYVSRAGLQFPYTSRHMCLCRCFPFLIMCWMHQNVISAVCLGWVSRWASWVEAQVTKWNLTLTQAVDSITYKHSLHLRGPSAPWFTWELQTSKQTRRVESIWRKTSSDINRAAEKSMPSQYCKTIQGAENKILHSDLQFVRWIGEGFIGQSL